MTINDTTDPRGAEPPASIPVPLPIVPVEIQADITKIHGYDKLTSRKLSARMAPLAIAALQRIADRVEAHNDANKDDQIYVTLEDATRLDSEALQIWAHGRARKPGHPALDPRSWTIIDPGLVRSHAFPGSSPHRGVDGGPEGGDAIDVALRDVRSRVWLRGGGTPDPQWAAIVGATADELGLIWGGRFHSPDGKPFFDGGHLQHGAWRKPSPVV